MSQIVILGNGIAGITAARHIRKRSDQSITIVSGETDHFFSRTALMYIYMGHMKYEHTKPYEDWFWEKNNLQLKRGWVKTIDFDDKKLLLEKEELAYDKLILAVGSKPNKFGWPGQDLNGVQGLYSYQDLEQLEDNTKGIQEAVIVGGGLIGIELSEMLHSRHIPVTYLVRERHFWNNVLTDRESRLIDTHIRENGIDLRLETNLEEIIDDGNGKVAGVRTAGGEKIDCQFVGLTVGVSPNIEFLKNSALETDKGILVDDYLQTNIPDVYALGDCAQLRNPKPGRRAIEAVWYTGRLMGETVALTLTGQQTSYNPGPWFNSAKFYDIEYQTYGNVANTPGPGEQHFVWQGADGKRSLTINYNEADHTVLGVNVLGIRMRHEVWESWLRDRVQLGYVIQHLKKANFDPEFFKQHDIEIQEEYNRQFPDKPIAQRKKTFLEKIFA